MFFLLKLPAMASQSFVGWKVGNIRIERQLGAGGMGEVYLGHDTRLDRRVAVKTIRAEHRFEPEMKLRFLREARILSKLEHPAICQVYDLIEGDDADFLIFEFVEGQTLKELFAQGTLETSRTLHIAEKIAQALVAAHRERIVHRDLKPENIMVTAGDGVKILDFGISRAVRDGQDEPVMGLSDSTTTRLLAPIPVGEAGKPTEKAGHVLKTAKTLPGIGSVETAATVFLPRADTGMTLDSDLTERGYVVGTVRYMSPEQARAEHVAEPSDLYSFGILLQEMLTGKPAYELISRERLAWEVAVGKTIPIAGFDPELVALVERLKSPSPPARPTAVEAAERLRFVLDKPAREREQRRRRRLAAGAFAALIVVLVVVSLLALRASRAAERAEREAARATSEARNARAVADFVATLFEQAAPHQALDRQMTARDLVDRGARQIVTDFREQPAERALFQDAIGMLYWRLGLYEEAAEHLEAALSARLNLLGPNDLETARTRLRLATVLSDQDAFEPAIRHFAEAQTAYEAVAAESVELAGLLNDFASLHVRRGEATQALPLFEKALLLDIGFFGEDSLEVADRRTNLATIQQQLGNNARALELFDEALAVHEKQGGLKSLESAKLLNNQGIALREVGQVPQAIAQHRRALDIALPMLGKDHPDIGTFLSSLARAQGVEGNLRDAKEGFEKALEIESRVRGRDSLNAGRLLADLADILRRQGDLPGAAVLLGEARAILGREDAEPHRFQVGFFQALSRLERQLEDPVEARAALNSALKVASAVYPEGHPTLLAVRRELALLAGSSNP